LNSGSNSPIHQPTNSPTLFGALGDIHGAFAETRRIIARHPEIPFWVCVGDIATDDGRYESLGAPIYWIYGNNDNFDAIASRDLPPDLHHIDNGTAVTIVPSDVGHSFRRAGDAGRPFRSGITVAGLGGTFAPTWYETPADALPHLKKSSAKATQLADKRRHFVREQVDACKALRDIDLFLTHEAATPFRPFPGGRGPDAGKPQINEILAAMKPRLHLFGHHHRFTEQDREGVRSVGLDLASRSYLLVNADTLEYESRA
jgi:calcineurin-like phosphoesterase family protein